MRTAWGGRAEPAGQRPVVAGRARTGRPQLALEHFQLGLDIVRQLNDPATESQILELMAEFYTSQGEYEQAWALQQQHLAVQDQVMSTQISQRVASIQLQHRISQQSAENGRLQLEAYISSHTDAQFSHGICEDCV